jgi:endonuclease/exonuclease/phosphatase family metal-dependent hydrolase
MIVLSCNIRYSRARDGDDSWPLRRDLCLRVILGRSPDVICFQEMTDEQFAWLSPRLKGFAFLAPTDAPAGRDPMNAIFYRTGRFTLIAAGAYWLSRTPHVPGTKSWASNCIRMVNWARLAIHGAESGTALRRELRVVNTHLDHVSQRARVHQARMIARDCSAYPANFPQVLTGDFNCDHRNAAVRTLLRSGFHDTYEAVHDTRDPFPTFHEFHGREYQSQVGKMDWVMVRGGWDVRSADIVTDSENGRYPSDHFFVAADIVPVASRTAVA